MPLSVDVHLAYPMHHDGDMVLGDAYSYPDRTNGASVGGQCTSYACEVLDYILSIFSPTCTMQLRRDLGKECVWGEGRWW